MNQCDILPKGLFALMHQRMDFYISDDKWLLAFGYDAIYLNPKEGFNDGKGQERK